MFRERVMFPGRLEKRKPCSCFSELVSHFILFSSSWLSDIVTLAKWRSDEIPDFRLVALSISFWYIIPIHLILNIWLHLMYLLLRLVCIWQPHLYIWPPHVHIWVYLMFHLSTSFDYTSYVHLNIINICTFDNIKHTFYYMSFVHSYHVIPHIHILLYLVRI